MVKIVYGAGGFTAGRAFDTPDAVNKVLEVLEASGIKNIDSAQIYGDSEVFLGQTKAASRFVIDTKHCGGWIPGQSSGETVVARGKESLKKLQTDQVSMLKEYLMGSSASPREASSYALLLFLFR
jgi:aflatoxin B1 aldehyde reductase